MRQHGVEVAGGSLNQGNWVSQSQGERKGRESYHLGENEDGCRDKRHLVGL